MVCEIDNENAQTIVNNLNLMCTNEDGYSVINPLLESDTKYTYMQADTHSENGEGYFNPKNNTICLNDPKDSMTFTEETFHAFQYFNGQGGLTAVNEVEAKLFSSKMNLEINIWCQRGDFLRNSAGLGNSTFGDSMGKLLYFGFNMNDYSNAVNTFFYGKLSGGDYKKLGYILGKITSEPLIKRFLPAK